MDDQQTRKVDEAAQQFSEALVESYRTTAGRTVSAQEHNAQLTQNFFNGVINNLRTQAEANRGMIQELANQQQRQQEASRALAQESASAYMEFLDSMFFFYRRSAQEAETDAEETQSSAGEAGSSVE